MTDFPEFRDHSSISKDLEATLDELKDRERLTFFNAELFYFPYYFAEFGHEQADVVINRVLQFMHKMSTREHINYCAGLVTEDYDTNFMGFTEEPKFLETNILRAINSESYHCVVAKGEREVSFGEKKLKLDPQKVSAVVGAVSFKPGQRALAEIMELAEKAKEEAKISGSNFKIYDL
jgi:hypothetical protein